MTQKPKYYRDPTLIDVERMSEIVGYDYFFPPKLFKHILYTNCFHILEGDKNKAFIRTPETPYEEDLQELLINLPFKIVENYEPLEGTFLLLKHLAKEINFFELEKGGDFKTPSNNFCTADINFKEFDVDTSDLEHEELATLVKLYGIFKDSFGSVLQENFQKVINKMQKPTDVFKVQKSKFKRPDFLLKALKKTFQIKSNKKTYKNEKIVIYLEDNSASMLKNKGRILAKAMQTLLINQNIPVHYYRFAGGILSFEILNTKEDKIKAFNGNKFFNFRTDYNQIVKEINKKYDRGEVILLSDGNDYVGISNTKSLIYNYIGLNHNLDMKNFIKYTGGKYLII